jgi:hypothetical protein
MIMKLGRKADPFEVKWSIPARSYSVLLRKRFSLDKFLELCVPLIGVSSRDIFFSVAEMGAR